MLRTSRHRPLTNYWGLVQQRGPWDETPIDKERLKQSKIYKIGGGVPDGGTEHAGHGIWSTTINPNPQFSNLPPMPPPSTYAQIYNIVPGPPQLPPVPGRPPIYLFQNPDSEKQGSFHQNTIKQKVSTDALPGTPLNPIIKDIQDAQIRRDLMTGPLGHSFDYQILPEIYYKSEDPNSYHPTISYDAINTDLQPPNEREGMNGRPSTYTRGPPLRKRTNRTQPEALTPTVVSTQIAQLLTDADVALKSENSVLFQSAVNDIVSIIDTLGIDITEEKSQIQSLSYQTDFNEYGPEIKQIIIQMFQKLFTLPSNLYPTTQSPYEDSSVGIVVRRKGTTPDIKFNPSFNETYTTIPTLPSISFEEQVSLNSAGIKLSTTSTYNKTNPKVSKKTTNQRGFYGKI